MKAIIAAGGLALLLNAAAAAQTGLDGNSLTWLIGNRVATSAAGAKTFEAFTGPQNGVVTGTALAANGAFTEYHKIGPQMNGPAGAPYGLSVANTRGNMVWNFTPLKVIEKDKIVFESADGVRRITYFAEPGNGVGAWVENTANGTTTKTEYHFKTF
jgi:hypothetical protein